MVRGNPRSKIGSAQPFAERAFHNMEFTSQKTRLTIPFFENTFHMPKNKMQAIETQRLI
jgi:hypothetical protein